MIIKEKYRRVKPLAPEYFRAPASTEIEESTGGTVAQHLLHSGVANLSVGRLASVRDFTAQEVLHSVQHLSEARGFAI